MHKVLVKRLEGPSLFTKSLVRLNDPPDMTLAVYHGCKTTTRTTINIGTDKSEQIVQTQIRLLHQGSALLTILSGCLRCIIALKNQTVPF